MIYYGDTGHTYARYAETCAQTLWVLPQSAPSNAQIICTDTPIALIGAGDGQEEGAMKQNIHKNKPKPHDHRYRTLIFVTTYWRSSGWHT